MNRTLKITRYLFRDNLKSMLIYYGIIMMISGLMITAYLQFINKSNGEMHFGGFGFSAFIFIFVVGLNSFKANFKFMQANNITRRGFYIASIIMLISLSGLMAFADLMLNYLLSLVIPYENIFAELHNSTSFIVNLIWSFALFALAASSGWFITILYYICNKFMKTVVSISPVLLIILLGLLDNVTGGAIGRAFPRLVLAALGITSNNPYVAVLSFSIGTALALLLSYVIVKRAALKD